SFGYQGEVAGEDAVDQRTGGPHRYFFTKRPSRYAGDIIARTDAPENAVAPIIRRQLQSREPLSPLPGDEHPVPVTPGPVASHHHAQILLGADHSRQHPALRCAVVELDIEQVAIRLRMHQQCEPVLAA